MTTHYHKLLHNFRAIEFVYEFLTELLAGVQDLEDAANTAYGRTLKPYHSYVVRGIYSVSISVIFYLYS